MRTVSTAFRCFFLLVWTSFLMGQVPAQNENPPIDPTIDQLIRLDPAALAARLTEMKGQAAALEVEAARLREEAHGLDNRLAEINQRLDPLTRLCTSLMDFFHPPPSAPEMMAAAPPATEPPPVQEATMATINFEEHIKPLLAARCLRCHNNDKRRSGLSLETQASALEGGSSGAVIVPGQPDASRLFLLASGREEPKMPPSGDPLDAAQLDLLRNWIALGAPASKDSKVLVMEEKKEETAPVFVAASFVEGPPPLPEVVLQPPGGGSGRGVVARALAASPRAPLLAVGGQHQVLLYHTESGQWLGALQFAEGDLYLLEFSVNGEILFAAGGKEGESGSVVLWNVRKGERATQFKEDFDVVLAADVSPDHRMVALGGPNRKVSVYSVSDGALLYKLDSHTDWIHALKFSPDGELLASADRGGNLMLWQAANGRVVETLRGHEGAIHALSFSPDSALLASSGEDGTVHVWDSWQYTLVRKFSAHSGAAASVQFTPEGQMITTGADRLTKRWDSSGNVLSTYSELPDWGYSACFLPQGSLVFAGSWNGEIGMWKSDTGELVRKLSTAAPASQNAPMTASAQ
jgi:WD40 repeat protein